MQGTVFVSGGWAYTLCWGYSLDMKGSQSHLMAANIMRWVTAHPHMSSVYQHQAFVLTTSSYSCCKEHVLPLLCYTLWPNSAVPLRMFQFMVLASQLLLFCFSILSFGLQLSTLFSTKTLILSLYTCFSPTNSRECPKLAGEIGEQLAS